ncbi:FabG Dehydrogenases with different specificities (related to short-chain alcohol dehydrogenases) [Burkholderiales bacterium]|jgi:3-oxoacyl-[acyl-carrier protein] reductase
MQIKGRVAVITGGGNGIGEAIAKDLAQRGAKIVVVDQSLEQATRVAAEIESSGGEALAQQANVTQEEDTARFVQATLDRFGELNIAVACAGIIRDGLTLSPDKETGKISRKLGLDKWQQVIDVNLTGSFLTMRDCAEAMANGGWPGLLVGISSVNKVGQVGQINYASTKAAIALMPKILVGEFMLKGIRNIRAVSIAPGYTATALLKGMNQDALESILKDVHLGRLVEPAEIASLIAHCAENEAINATTLEITGGLCYPHAIAK